MHVEVNPELLRWACDRACMNTPIVAEKIPQKLSTFDELSDRLLGVA
jgi:hypothetical protein